MRGAGTRQGKLLCQQCRMLPASSAFLRSEKRRAPTPCIRTRRVLTPSSSGSRIVPQNCTRSVDRPGCPPAPAHWPAVGRSWYGAASLLVRGTTDSRVTAPGGRVQRSIVGLPAPLLGRGGGAPTRVSKRALHAAVCGCARPARDGTAVHGERSGGAQAPHGACAATSCSVPSGRLTAPLRNLQQRTLQRRRCPPTCTATCATVQASY